MNSFDDIYEVEAGIYDEDDDNFHVVPLDLLSQTRDFTGQTEEISNYLDRTSISLEDIGASDTSEHYTENSPETKKPKTNITEETGESTAKIPEEISNYLDRTSISLEDIDASDTSEHYTENSPETKKPKTNITEKTEECSAKIPGTAASSSSPVTTPPSGTPQLFPLRKLLKFLSIASKFYGQVFTRLGSESPPVLQNNFTAMVEVAKQTMKIDWYLKRLEKNFQSSPMSKYVETLIMKNQLGNDLAETKKIISELNRRISRCAKNVDFQIDTTEAIIQASEFIAKFIQLQLLRLKQIRVKYENKHWCEANEGKNEKCAVPKEIVEMMKVRDFLHAQSQLNQNPDTEYKQFVTEVEIVVLDLIHVSLRINESMTENGK